MSHKVGGGEWVWIFEAKVWMFVACTLTLLSQTWLNKKGKGYQIMKLITNYFPSPNYFSSIKGYRFLEVHNVQFIALKSHFHGITFLLKEAHLLDHGHSFLMTV